MKLDELGTRTKAFCGEEEGVTAIEYALLAALIFGVIVASVHLVGDALVALYQDVAAKVAAAVT